MEIEHIFGEDRFRPPTPPLPAHNFTRLQELDPELWDDRSSGKLLAVGFIACANVTAKFGSPDEPTWSHGRHESDVFTAYHNGGYDGHTSLGKMGAGVPLNGIQIAKAIGHELCPVPFRAMIFAATGAHDETLLCGRSLLPEGQGEHYGDERLSAESAEWWLQHNGIDERIARLVHLAIKATAFNPQTGSQNIDYEAWGAHPQSRDATEETLLCEITAGADLLGVGSRRGRLGAIECAIESLALLQNGQILQERLQARGIEAWRVQTVPRLLAIMKQDKILREEFTAQLEKQSKFFGNMRFSDKVIQQVSGGLSLDSLAPYRPGNGVWLGQAAAALASREATPFQVWNDARVYAGYASAIEPPVLRRRPILPRRSFK